MNEQQWLTENDPEKLLSFLRNTIGLRKLRLFVCASWRRVLPLLDEQSATALQATEQAAEDESMTEEKGHDLFTDANDATDRFAWSVAFDPRNSSVDGGQTYERERATQCCLLRDVIRNPFQAATSVSAILTPAIVRLAQAAYQDRSLPTGTLSISGLALLADALEIAGCADAELLTHCRSAGPHVRGCWVVDLVMGKSQGYRTMKMPGNQGFTSRER